jgi:hypothetical protein
MKLHYTSRLALAAATLAATAATAGAQSLTYGPGTAKYRTTGSSKMVQEVMGQKMDADITMSRLVTVQVEPRSGDTLAVTVRLDSVTTQMGAMPAPGLDALFGTSTVALMSRTGQHFSHTVSGDTANPAVAGLADELARFLPRVRGELRPGATWTDTIADKGNQGGVEVDRHAVVVSRVVGQETFNGVRAWKIDRAVTATLSGSGAMQGQPVSMEGTVNTKGAVYVTRDAYIGTEQTDEVKMKVTMIANGMEVSITQSGSQKTERVQ